MPALSSSPCPASGPGRQRLRAVPWLVAALIAVPLPAAAQFRGVDGLVRAYDAILDADFDRAQRLIDAACPPAPEPACRVLEATRLLWRIQIDPEQQAHDAAFTEAVEAAIEATEAFAEAEPDSAEAAFYVGAAYAARVQWKVLRREPVSAARDGKRVKEALDRALELAPDMVDAQFGLGLYEYYAAQAPALARFLRVLLMLPGGNRERGLARMQKTRRQGVLLADEATYQLHLVYLWYEKRPKDALSLLRELVSRHPANPYFRRLVADTLDTYFHDDAGSLAAARDLLARARAGTVHERDLAENEARLRIAQQLDAMGDTDLAVAELTHLLGRNPQRPWAATRRAQLLLGRAYDRLGEWSKAEALFEAVASGEDDPLGLRDQARRALRNPTPFSKGEAHRLALEAWRAFERDARAPVLPQFERALTLDPQNGVARYRYARALDENGQPERAIAELERLLRSPGRTPATTLADAALFAAHLYERAENPDAAARLYRRAAETFGGSAETRTAARRGLERLARVTR